MEAKKIINSLQKRGLKGSIKDLDKDLKKLDW
mgnify:CR=1 FL=1